MIQCKMCFIYILAIGINGGKSMKKHKPAHSKTLAILLAVSLLTGILLPSILSKDKALAVSQSATVFASKDKYVDAEGGYNNWTVSGRSYL